MSGLWGMLAAGTLAVLGFALLAAAALAVLAPPILRRAGTRSPAERARLAFRLGVAPAAFGLLATALCFLPGIAGLVGLAQDHCLQHDDGHLHLCLVHRPALSGVAEFAALGAVALFLLVLLVREVRARILVRRLWQTAAFWNGPLVEVDVPLPFAITVGRLRPKVVLSSALRAALPPRQLDVVVAHETAHAHRRDALRRFLLDLLAFLHLPALRRRLITEHALACEQACDEVAAQVTGDRLLVAETILAVERLLPHRPLLGAAFADSNVEARVGSLLAPAPAARNARGTAVWIAFALGLSLVLADLLHHFTETLLGVLTR